MNDMKLTPHLEPGVCIYCGIKMMPFSITPLMESACGNLFHEMCENCADKHHEGWREEDE